MKFIFLSKMSMLTEYFPWPTLKVTQTLLHEKATSLRSAQLQNGINGFYPFIPGKLGIDKENSQTYNLNGNILSSRLPPAYPVLSL